MQIERYSRAQVRHGSRSDPYRIDTPVDWFTQELCQLIETYLKPDPQPRHKQYDFAWARIAREGTEENAAPTCKFCDVDKRGFICSKSERQSVLVLNVKATLPQASARVMIMIA